MMNDLISRKTLLNDLCTDREEGTFCFTDSQAEAADKIIMYVTKRIEVQPTIEAVPLDKLCEWLAENAEFPMEVEVKIFYEPTEEPEIILNRMPNDAERWREKLTKWMEGLDAEVH